MVDTLTSSSGRGGDIEAPPAPPTFSGDMPWERRAIESATRAAEGRLQKTAPFLAYLALPRAVFNIDEPIVPAVTPYGMERFDTIYSAN